MTVSVLVDILDIVNAEWGWALVLLFFCWEFFNPLPFHDTKIQSYFNDYEQAIQQLREDHIDTKDRLADIAHQQQRSIRILRAVVRETDGVEDRAADKYLLEDEPPVSHFQSDPSEKDIEMDKAQYSDDETPADD